jgi:hypothetical protein
MLCLGGRRGVGGIADEVEGGEGGKARVSKGKGVLAAQADVSLNCAD